MGALQSRERGGRQPDAAGSPSPEDQGLCGVMLRGLASAKLCLLSVTAWDLPSEPGRVEEAMFPPNTASDQSVTTVWRDIAPRPQHDSV